MWRVWKTSHLSCCRPPHPVSRQTMGRRRLLSYLTYSSPRKKHPSLKYDSHVIKYSSLVLRESPHMSFVIRDQYSKIIISHVITQRICFSLVVLGPTSLKVTCLKFYKSDLMCNLVMRGKVRRLQSFQHVVKLCIPWNLISGAKSCGIKKSIVFYTSLSEPEWCKSHSFCLAGRMMSLLHSKDECYFSHKKIISGS